MKIKFQFSHPFTVKIAIEYWARKYNLTDKVLLSEHDKSSVLTIKEGYADEVCTLFALTWESTISEIYDDYYFQNLDMYQTVDAVGS
jgi:hypothetical protein